MECGKKKFVHLCVKKIRLLTAFISFQICRKLPKKGKNFLAPLGQMLNAYRYYTGYPDTLEW